LVVPGKHNNENQKFVGCYMTPDFLVQIDQARGELSRSQFLRDAIFEKLDSLGFAIAREKVIAPDRTGKGGPKKKAVKPAMVQDVVSSRPSAGHLRAYIDPSVGKSSSPRKP